MEANHHQFSTYTYTHINDKCIWSNNKVISGEILTNFAYVPFTHMRLGDEGSPPPPHLDLNYFVSTQLMLPMRPNYTPHV